MLRCAQNAKYSPAWGVMSRRSHNLRKALIFGNSGSGKSTLARKLCAENELAHLDLDTLAWMPVSPPERTPLAKAKIEIDRFIGSNEGWVIEGCYTDLLEMAILQSSEIIFMNLPIASCIANAKNRPWEPHKYESKEAQDANLEMLISWISQYSERADVFSKSSHIALYEKYFGAKVELTSNEQAHNHALHRTSR